MLNWVFVLTVSAACVQIAQSAEKVVPQGTTVQLLLLRQKSVQEELKLTPEVVKKVMDFTNKQADSFRGDLKLGKEEAKAKVKALGNENKQFLEMTLTPVQNKRLRQVTLQVTGLYQLTRSDVAKVLNLTKAQQLKFKALRKVTRKKLGLMLEAKSPQVRKELFSKLRAETRKKIRAILTKEQKAKVKQLVGKQFKGDIVIEGAEAVPQDEKSDK
jgi:hypothetical protein